MSDSLTLNHRAATEDVTAAPAKSKARRLAPPRALLAVVAAVALAGVGAAYILSPKATASTDDAYVRADSAMIAPKVRGFVADVLAHDNQIVKAGDPLVRINPEEFDSRVASAEADLLSARAAEQMAKAALISLDAEEKLADSNIQAAETSIRSADAQNVRAAADRRRFDDLATTGAGTRRDADLYRAGAITAQSDADHSRVALAVSQNQAALTRAKRPGLVAAVSQAEAAIARASAALDLARQDQKHTVIYAPIDGVVGNRQVQTGDYVQPGTRLLSLVPLHDLYVTANFKETQTERMSPGQAASVEADALPGVTLKGEVESFAPGSGSEFSLLPFEPGTGNFTKIVQRVPVRIHFDANQPELARLRPGLSVTVTVSLASRNATR